MLEIALRILLWECETKIRRRAHNITSDVEECGQIHILRVGTRLIPDVISESSSSSQ